MNQKLKAVYRNGVFSPKTPCDLPEGAVVELTVGRTVLLPPTVTDPEERSRVLKGLIACMERNPIPPDSPRFSRDELHERR